MKLKTALAALITVACVANVSAAELVVSKFEKAGKTFLSFDLVDATNIYGVQFKVNVPGMSGVDTSKCAVGLAEKFNGNCVVRDGSVTITGFTAAGNRDNALNSAAVMIGQISFASDQKAAMTITSALVSDGENDIELPVTIK